MPNKVYIYPVNRCIKLLLENKESFKNGNFGLRFNKFIPISEPIGNDKFQACGENGEKNTAVDFYNEVYNNNKNSDKLHILLKDKHYSQYSFYKSKLYEEKYEVLIITAELISPLITGIGQTHPNEVGMTFDHTLGIPYIPASSIKGVVRFSHTLGLLGDLSSKHHDEIKKNKNNEEYFDDEAGWTNISEIFGKGGNKDNESNMGNIIFLDAYPESVPNLSVDIMNPHYGEYYSDDTGKTPPADYLNPIPIKFLTVAKGTKFIFRYMINKAKSSELMKPAKAAIKKALTEEGIGAKTAVGYGLFKIDGYDEPVSVKDLIKKKEEERKKKIGELAQIKEINEINNMSEVDKICYILKNDYNEKRAGDICRDLDSNNNEEDKIKIAEALKEAYMKIRKWDKKANLSDKQKEKVKKIKSILNE